MANSSVDHHHLRPKLEYNSLTSKSAGRSRRTLVCSMAIMSTYRQIRLSGLCIYPPTRRPNALLGRPPSSAGALSAAYRDDTFNLRTQKGCLSPRSPNCEPPLRSIAPALVSVGIVMREIWLRSSGECWQLFGAMRLPAGLLVARIPAIWRYSTQSSLCLNPQPPPPLLHLSAELRFVGLVFSRESAATSEHRRDHPHLLI